MDCFDSRNNGAEPMDEHALNSLIKKLGVSQQKTGKILGSIGMDHLAYIWVQCLLIGHVFKPSLN